jgi:hypothetical protein
MRRRSQSSSADERFSIKSAHGVANGIDSVRSTMLKLVDGFDKISG